MLKTSKKNSLHTITFNSLDKMTASAIRSTATAGVIILQSEDGPKNK